MVRGKRRGLGARPGRLRPRRHPCNRRHLDNEGARSPGGRPDDTVRIEPILDVTGLPRDGPARGNYFLRAVHGVEPVFGRDNLGAALGLEDAEEGQAGPVAEIVDADDLVAKYAHCVRDLRNLDNVPVRRRAIHRGERREIVGGRGGFLGPACEALEKVATLAHELERELRRDGNLGGLRQCGKLLESAQTVR